MARKRKRRGDAPPPDPSRAHAVTAGRRRALAAVLGVLLLLGGTAVAVRTLRERGAAAPPSAPRLAAFPKPPAPPAASVEPDDFVGAETCGGCHAKQYRAWSASTHGRAGGAPGPDVVIAPFDGRPIRFANATVIPRIRGGIYEFVVREDGFAEEVFRVDGVIGGGHMRGGGTQGFVTRRRDGTVRFLPWDWSRTESKWFCNTGSRLNRGWLPITRTMKLADCGDWPPVRPLGTVARFANCQECHGSQIRTTFDARSGAYHTSYTSLRVNCESCHGPGRAHVEKAGSLGFGDGNLRINTLANLDKDASLDVCFRCHALKDVVREGYLPGDTLADYYALKFPVLGDQPYFADGRVRTFAYQANHLASACYLEGPMDCVSCHEPHGQGYWDTNRRPLASPFDNGQCTSCHPSKAVDVRKHTFHPPDSEGSRCVSCHMPYLQHPELGREIRFARSDHTIAIPRPAFDADLGITDGCAQCHRDRSARTLQRQAEAWWGALRPHRPLVQGLVDELRARNVAEAGALLLRPDQHDPLIQFEALARLLVGYLDPDAPQLPDTVLVRLERLATGSPDPEVKALALASLHWSRGNDPAVRELLVRALAHDPGGRLRARWGLALGFLGDVHRDRKDRTAARAAYAKALELLPDNPKILHAQGLMYTGQGDYLAAVRAFRRAIELDPDLPLARVNLGIALAAMGDAGGAIEAYRAALTRNPHEALAYFNLGNVYRRADDLGAAVDEYRKAIVEDPGLGRAYFELARALILLGRRADALAPARRAVEFMPEHVPARQMLADLEKAAKGG